MSAPGWREVVAQADQAYVRAMAETASPPRLPARSIVWLAGSVGLLLAGTVALWAHYGTAVFFETIRAGFAACF